MKTNSNNLIRTPRCECKKQSVKNWSNKMVHRQVLLWVIIMIICFSSCVHGILTPHRPCEAQGCHCNARGQAICDCSNINQQNISLMESGNTNIQEIHVMDCLHVSLNTNTIRNLTSLQQVVLSNIHDLVLSEKSLFARGFIGHPVDGTGVRITIKNSTIKQIPSYAFKGNILRITILKSKINEIRAFAFSNIRNLQIINILESEIDYIHPQAFKKISFDILKISQSVFTRNLESRTFSDLLVRNSLVIEYSSFRNIRSSAFIIGSPERVEVMNSRFDILEGEAFRIIGRDKFIFRNNSFQELNNGAFAGLSVPTSITRVHGLKDFIFEDNTIATIHTEGFRLNQTSLQPSLRNVYLNQKCQCEFITNFKQMDNKLLCLEIENTSNSFITLQKLAIISCYESGLDTTLLIIIIVSSLLVVLLITAVVAWVYVLHRRNVKSKLPIHEDKGQMDVVMPEPRTYRETEVHVIVERAELLTTDL